MIPTNGIISDFSDKKNVYHKSRVFVCVSVAAISSLDALNEGLFVRCCHTGRGTSHGRKKAKVTRTALSLSLFPCLSSPDRCTAVIPLWSSSPGFFRSPTKVSAVADKPSFSMISATMCSCFRKAKRWYQVVGKENLDMFFVLCFPSSLSVLFCSVRLAQHGRIAYLVPCHRVSPMRSSRSN